MGDARFIALNSPTLTDALVHLPSATKRAPVMALLRRWASGVEIDDTMTKEPGYVCDRLATASTDFSASVPV